GMLIGPAADAESIDEFRGRILADPRRYIAQEVVRLTRHPTLVGSGLAPRHVDLRPFIVQGGSRIEVLPGGLTRVALREGSLVVNSSQGGGSKDTWVLDETTWSPRESAATRRLPVRPLREARDDAALGWQQPQQQQASGTERC
ncbi:MAG: circularly permuted type 2 ATP-grasp protein, partial [Actinomycetota bacterium]